MYNAEFVSVLYNFILDILYVQLQCVCMRLYVSDEVKFRAKKVGRELTAQLAAG